MTRRWSFSLLGMIVKEVLGFLASPFGRRAGQEGAKPEGRVKPSPQPSPEGEGVKNHAAAISASSISKLA